jgi:hypothetical protein
MNPAAYHLRPTSDWSRFVRPALFINLILMIIGIIGLLVYQYIPLLSGGTLSIPGEPLLTILGYQFIPLLGILGLLILLR